jgi:hypothetical protein
MADLVADQSRLAAATGAAFPRNHLAQGRSASLSAASGDSSVTQANPTMGTPRPGVTGSVHEGGQAQASSFSLSLGPLGHGPDGAPLGGDVGHRVATGETVSVDVPLSGQGPARRDVLYSTGFCSCAGLAIRARIPPAAGRGGSERLVLSHISAQDGSGQYGRLLEELTSVIKAGATDVSAIVTRDVDIEPYTPAPPRTSAAASGASNATPATGAGHSDASQPVPMIPAGDQLLPRLQADLAKLDTEGSPLAGYRPEVTLDGEALSIRFWPKAGPSPPR